MVTHGIRTGGWGWLDGEAIGMFNCRKVFCMQKFFFATLAMMIAISIFAIHTWHAIVGPCWSLSKLVDMKCR